MVEIIYLSAELVYYSICIPMLFSQKNNVYINSKTLIVYSIIIFIHALLLQFSFFYKKNCANFHVYCKLMGKWRKIVINDSLKQ